MKYHEHMENLTCMYKPLKVYYEGVTIDREFSRKVAELVRKHTHGGEILESTRAYEINEKRSRNLKRAMSQTLRKSSI